MFVGHNRQRMPGGGSPPTWPPFVPAKTLVGQLLGQISAVLSVTYAICPRISQKKIRRHSSGLAPSQCGRACPTVPSQLRLPEAACRRQRPFFVPAKTPLGQLLGQRSAVLSVTYTICPRISQKKIKSNCIFHDHLRRSQMLGSPRMPEWNLFRALPVYLR